ncbi:MAG: amidophosphoribosyltransferase [Elusimicrobia bacterium]|nr:amidophosphoribosyltransferase [Elusimicrobiota bacterium]
MKEECGVFGIFNHPEASRLATLGLHALQHRGQEAAGIASWGSHGFCRRVGLGLVSSVFDRRKLSALSGHLAIGHVRYATAGRGGVRNAQPLVAQSFWGKMALAHNGNLTNSGELKRRLQRRGVRFTSSSDTEVILRALSLERGDLSGALRRVLAAVRGAYSLVVATPQALMAVRDPKGFRPLCLGSYGESYLVASETCAFDLIGAQYLRDVAPGEILRLDSGGLSSSYLEEAVRRSFCVFELVYFAKPSSRAGEASVYQVRRQMGRELAREAPVRADRVIPVPDSAVVHAEGFAEESGIPFAMALIRSHYVGRTFIEPRQSIRDFGAKLKYAVVREAVCARRVVLVDDSIVRGTTCRKLVRLIYDAGAREVHLRIGSPPITHPCFYGIDTPTQKELVASRLSVEEIRKFLGVESLAFLSVEGMLRATGKTPEDFCTACFTGQYREDGERIRSQLDASRSAKLCAS